MNERNSVLTESNLLLLSNCGLRCRGCHCRVRIDLSLQQYELANCKIAHLLLYWRKDWHGSFMTSSPSTISCRVAMSNPAISLMMIFPVTKFSDGSFRSVSSPISRLNVLTTSEWLVVNNHNSIYTLSAAALSKPISFLLERCLQMETTSPEIPCDKPFH